MEENTLNDQNTSTIQIQRGDNGGSGSGSVMIWKKYQVYELEVDPYQDDKACEIQICNFSRPHMRAFHCSWWSFFTAFFIWFAISPLLPYIQESLQLTNEQIWTSSIAGVGGTILVRLIVGPLCDKYGARIFASALLCGASIPCAMTGLVETAEGLAVLRCFIGIAGGTFVTCQYWTSRMFTKEVVGTANAVVAGWGNLGASCTQIIIGGLLLPLYEKIHDGDTETAWRRVSVAPSIAAFVTGIIVYFISDDCPKGNYYELKDNNTMKEVSAVRSFALASVDKNAWILLVQYACCFGVELTMNNAAALYFRDVFGLSTGSAAAIASIFGWMNLFARGLGGVLSDTMNESLGMRGRIIAQTVLLFLEGIAVIVFSVTGTLAGAVISLVMLSLLVQATEGTSFGIVPYVKPTFMGSVSGIVGAGGNVGAVCFGFGFRELDYGDAFLIMGSAVIFSSALSILLKIEGHRGLLDGEDLDIDKETGDVLLQDDSDDDDARDREPADSGRIRPKRAMFSRANQ